MTTRSKDSFYGAKDRLLSGLAKALTDGKVSRVEVSGRVNTGVTEFAVSTGAVQRIVLPREENLPSGFTLDAARGLMDHEDAHALYTTVTGETRTSALVHHIANILEDPRVEALKGKRYPGAKENIAALQEIGLRVTREVMEGCNTMEAALRAMSLVTYRADLGPVLARPDAGKLLAFLKAADPHIQAALAADTTAQVMVEAQAIEALLKEPRRPEPVPPPEATPEAEPGEDEDQDEGPSDGAGGGAQDPDQEEDGDLDASGDAGESQEPEAAEGPDPSEGDPSDEGEAQEGAAPAEAPEVPAEGGADDSSHDEAQGAEETAAEGPDPSEGDPSDEGEAQKGAAPAEAPEVPVEGGADDSSHEEAQDADETADEAPEAPESAIWEPSEEAAMDSATGFTPAEIVAALLEPALEEAKREAEADEALALREAEKSPLAAPRGLTARQFLEFIYTQDLKGTPGAYEVLRQEVRAVSMGVRNALRQHLLAEGRAHYLSDQEQGHLDPRALYKVAAGIPARPFRTMVQGKSTRTAITLLVDESGSMGCGGRMAHARLACAALWEGLKGLPGVSVEILGFTTLGACVKIESVKPFGSRDASGIADMSYQAGNADGASMRVAALRLLAQPADRRILIVLSDGDPTDTLEGGLDDAPADLRAAVDACERHGIETLGIGIADRAVACFYPKHVVIHRVEDLAGAVLKNLVELLKPKAREEGKRLARGR